MMASKDSFRNVTTEEQKLPYLAFHRGFHCLPVFSIQRVEEWLSGL